MNKRIVRAALVACLFGTAAAIAATAPLSSAYAAASEKPVTAPVGKLLDPASKLIKNSNDYAGALVLVKQAQALPDLPPWDTYKINEFLGNIYIHMNDHPNAEMVFAAMAEYPDIPPEDKAGTYRIATLLSAEAKHYDKSVKYGLAFVALGGAPDIAVLSNIGLSYYYLNDYANAEAFAQKAIDAAPAGTAPSRDALEVMYHSKLNEKKDDDASALLERIVSYYDDGDQWARLIDLSLQTKNLKDAEGLHMGRLRFFSKATSHGEDYTFAAALALQLGYPVEADTILQAGLDAGEVSNSGKDGALIADARKRAATDRQTIAGFDAIARKSPSGEFDQKLAEFYYGYGRYADAEEAARRALTKGGPKTDANEINMVLGEALLRQGKASDAAAAFGAVHASSAGMAKAQHLWLLYANRKVVAPAAAPSH